MIIRSNYILLLVTLLLCCVAQAEEWYVTGQGNDGDSGKTLQSSFRSLQKAADMVAPGDTVHIGDGIYRDSNIVLSVSTSGTEKKWITWRAIPGTTPEIHPTGWHGIFITGSYHIFDGISIIGDNDSITLEEAMVDSTIKEKDGNAYFGNPHFNTNGISVEGRKQAKDKKPHHIIIRNCTVAKCSGGGLTFLETDYITVEACLVYDNCWYMRYAGSGITTLNNWAFDNGPGYHFIVQRNRVWNNRTQVPWVATGKPSDGNGILFDVTDGIRDTKPGTTAGNVRGDTAKGAKKKDPNAASMNPDRPQWKNRSLIANNISAFNGGSGIHTFRTKHVDIINNTTYHNGNVVGYEELFPNRSEDVVIYNNIIVPRPGGKVTSNNQNDKIKWDYNLYPQEQDVFKGRSDIIKDPKFIDERRCILMLAPTSPGLDSATDNLPQELDIRGERRPAGKSRDRGAYEQ